MSYKSLVVFLLFVSWLSFGQMRFKLTVFCFSSNGNKDVNVQDRHCKSHLATWAFQGRFRTSFCDTISAVKSPEFDWYRQNVPFREILRKIWHDSGLSVGLSVSLSVQGKLRRWHASNFVPLLTSQFQKTFTISRVSWGRYRHVGICG